MENSWRFRPIEGNICSICSISHFPFCPQPLPAFDRIGYARDNPRRFPLDLNPSFHDPFPDNRPIPPHFSHFDLRPGNPLVASPSWNRSHLLEREPLFRAVDSAIPGSRFEYGRGGFFAEQFDERIHKKAKVDDLGLGLGLGLVPSTQLPPPLLPLHNDYVSNVARFSSEDQRLLNLIRDHGGQTNPLPQVETNPGGVRYTDIGTQANVGNDHRSEFDYGMDPPHSHLSPLPDRRLSHFNARERAALEDQRSTGSDWRSSGVLNSFDDHSGFVSVARQEPLAINQRNHSIQVDAYGDNRNVPGAHNSSIIDRVVVPHERHGFRGGDYKIGTEQQWMQSNNRDGLMSEMDFALRNWEETSKGALYHEQKHHGHHTQSYRTGNNSTGAVKYVEPVNQSGPDSVANYREDYGAQGSHDYDAYDHPQLQSKEFSSDITSKQPQYHHNSTWQVRNVQQQDQRSVCLPVENHLSNTLPPRPGYAMQNHVERNHELYDQQNDVATPFERKAMPLENNIRRPVEPELSDARNAYRRGGYSFMPAGSSITSSLPGHGQASQAFGTHPPLPPLPPQSFSKEPSRPSPSHFKPSSLPSTTCSPLYTVPVSSSTTVPSSLPPAVHGFSEVQSSSHAYFNKPFAHASSGFSTEGSQSIHQAPSKHNREGNQSFILKPTPPDKPKVINAAHLFRPPHRVNRPDHIVVILRGLPGSGKSYLAKFLRDFEVENGGNAPRIHSMDDYFMIEVEKVEETEGSKSSSSNKGKKRITKKVMEYCYEPEMEEAYRSSMLKAFKKTLEEGIFTFIIVDDRNLRVADFAQFWAIAKRSGYEVYLLEATYKDPMGCAARNVHGFTSEDIQNMADQWEEAPPLYLQLDVQSLFHGDDLNEHGIQEVDMDMEDVASDEDGVSGLQDRKDVGTIEQPLADYAHDDSFRAGERWDAERDDPTEVVKELGRSKWSEDVDEDIERTEGAKRNSNALSGLIQAYSKGEKSVRWGDQVGKSGFSIGAAIKTNISSLLIGPGAGYNLDSNPLPEDNADAIDRSNSTEPKRRTTFLEQLRAERESFRAVFDRRRQRIGGLDMDED